MLPTSKINRVIIIVVTLKTTLLSILIFSVRLSKMVLKAILGLMIVQGKYFFSASVSKSTIGKLYYFHKKHLSKKLVPDQANPAQFGWKSQSFSIYLHIALIAGSILCRNGNARRIKSWKNKCGKDGQSYNWCKLESRRRLGLLYAGYARSTTVAIPVPNNYIGPLFSKEQKKTDIKLL
jgi:hypothetical protein